MMRCMVVVAVAVIVMKILSVMCVVKIIIRGYLFGDEQIGTILAYGL